MSTAGLSQASNDSNSTAATEETIFQPLLYDIPGGIDGISEDLHLALLRESTDSNDIIKYLIKTKCLQTSILNKITLILSYYLD